MDSSTLSYNRGCNRPEHGVLNILARNEEIRYDYEILLASSDFAGSINIFAQLIQDEIATYTTDKLICDVQRPTFNQTQSAYYHVYDIDASPRDELNNGIGECASDESNPNCYPISGFLSVSCESCSMIVLQTVREAMENTDFSNLSHGNISKVIFLGQRVIPDTDQSNFDVLAGQLRSGFTTITSQAAENVTVLGGAFIAGLVLSFSLLIYRFKRKKQKKVQEQFCDGNDLELEEENYPRHHKQAKTGMVCYSGSRTPSVYTGSKLFAPPEEQRKFYNEPKIAHNNIAYSKKVEPSTGHHEAFQDEDEIVRKKSYKVCSIPKLRISSDDKNINYSERESHFSIQHVMESNYKNGDEEFEVEIF